MVSTRAYVALGLAVVLAASCRESTPPTPPIAGPLASLAIVSGDTQSGLVGDSIPVPIVAIAKDSAGLPVKGVQLRIIGVAPNGVWSFEAGQHVRTDERGLAAFRFVLPSKAGPQRYVVTTDGTPDLSAPFATTALAGPPAAIVFRDPLWSRPDTYGGYAGGPVDGPLAPPVFIVRDRFQNPIPNVTVHFTADSGSVVDGSDRPTDSTGGVSPVRWTLGAEVGKTYSLTATAGTVTERALATARSGPPSRIVVDFGDNQQALVGDTVHTPIGIAVYDAASRRVQNVRVTWSAGPSGAGQCVGFADGSGHAYAPCAWRVGTTPGEYVFATTAGDARGTVHATAVERPVSIEILGGPAPNSTLDRDRAPVDVSALVKLANGAPAKRYAVVKPRPNYGADTLLTDDAGMAHIRWTPSGLVGRDSITVFVGVVRAISTTLAVNVTGQIDFTRQIVAGRAHTCGFTLGVANGEFVCWGSNADGQLGEPTSVARRLRPSASFALAGPGLQEYHWLSSRQDHTCVERSHPVYVPTVAYEPTAYCWGANTDGQLGPHSNLSHLPDSVATALSRVVAGASHSCAIWWASPYTQRRGVACWGDNRFGALGDGSTRSRSTVAGVDSTLMGTQIVALAAGNGFSCALTTTGAAFCWGRNDAGQLGDGTTTNHTTPVRVTGGVAFDSVIVAGDGHVCAISKPGPVYCWGRNESAQLGDQTLTSHAEPTMVPGELAFTKLAAGGAHTCGITADNRAYCWGSNREGQLGVANSIPHNASPAPVAGGLTFAWIGAGAGHTCAIRPPTGNARGGPAYCWGLNADGQLGDGTTISRSAPTPVADYLPVPPNQPAALRRSP